MNIIHISFSLMIIVAVMQAVTFAENSTSQNPTAESAATPKVAEIPKSGFLGSNDIYDRLVKNKTKNGKIVYRWKSSKLTSANYKSVLIEDVVLYPAPEPSEQVSEDTLKRISAYTTNLLKEKIGATVPLAEKPGPGVLSMQTAITGVVIKTEGMKVYEVLPIAAVFGAVKAATGTRAENVLVHVEAKLVDSTDNELVGAGMRAVEGEKLKGKKDQLEVKDVHENLEHAATEAASFMNHALSE